MVNPKDESYPTRPSLLVRLKDTEDQQSWQEFNDLYGKLVFGFAIKVGLTETEALVKRELKWLQREMK